MTDKERLEEIETKYSTLTVSSEKNGTEYTEVDVEDLVFLIQNGFKQAERVQELESNSYNAHLERLLDRKEQEIERYREAIEYIQREIREAIYTPKNNKLNSDLEREFEKGKTRGLIQASYIVKDAIEILEGEKLLNTDCRRAK